MFVHMARLLGMCALAEQTIRERRRRRSHGNLHLLPRNRTKSLFTPSRSTYETETDERTAIMENNSNSPSQIKTANGGTTETTLSSPRRISSTNITNTDFQDGLPAFLQLPMLNRKRKTDSDPNLPDYTKDWRNMAEVFDRLFFWLFLLAILISTLVLFHPLTNTYLHGNQIKR